MSYTELKQYMQKWRIGEITKQELAIAIHMWQRTLYLENTEG